MTKHTVTLLLLVLAAPAFAQEPIPWANKFFSGTAEAPPPVILHDFGTVPKGAEKSYRFTMANIYSVPMQVKEPKAACGCVSVIEYTAKMNPKELGHIDIKMQTGSFDGKKSVKIPILFMGRDPKTDEPFFSTAQLEVRAESRADVAIAPGTIEFGQVPAGQKASQALTITYSGRQPGWKITEYGYRKELFDVAVASVNAPRGATAFQVTVTLKPDVPAGAMAEQIVLKTNDPAAAALTLTVNGSVLAALSVSGSDQIKLGGVEVGQKAEHRVKIQAGEAFKVTAIEG